MRRDLDTETDYRFRKSSAANGPNTASRFLTDGTSELVFSVLWSYVKGCIGVYIYNVKMLTSLFDHFQSLALPLDPILTPSLLSQVADGPPSRLAFMWSKMVSVTTALGCRCRGRNASFPALVDRRRYQSGCCAPHYFLKLWTTRRILSSTHDFRLGMCELYSRDIQQPCPTRSFFSLERVLEIQPMVLQARHARQFLARAAG